MAKLKVEVKADIWDEDGERIPAGTILDLEHKLAAKFIRSGNVELVVEEEPKKRGTPAGAPPPDPGAAT